MITSNEVREKYLKFFEKRGHVVIPPAPLVLEKDPTTLFTSSGMQPLVPYLMGQKHELGTRLVDSQSSIRLQDIDEVGDNRHTTYFEMLGNWSLGDYFKEEQLPWIWEFLTEELGLPKEKLYVSVFEGNESVPEDTEAFNIWKKHGVPEDHIFEYDVKKNWWSRSGTPDEMPIGEIGGPDSEIFFEFDNVKHDNTFGEKCHPNCDCGRFLEIGNSVFIQYKKNEKGELEELPQKNVDFGGGLERITAALNNDPDVFKTDIFWPTIEKLEKITGEKYEDNQRNLRIIADHLRASEALIASGVVPSNKMHGYVLRRLIRRAIVCIKNINSEFSENDIESLTSNKIIKEEVDKFLKSYIIGLKETQDEINLYPKEADKYLQKKWEQYGTTPNDVMNHVFVSPRSLSSLPSTFAGTVALSSVTTYGVPLEEAASFVSVRVPNSNINEVLEIARYGFEKHKDASRSTSKGMFRGGLEDHSEETTKLHTATHMLHASLRKVLGDSVSQKGSHITAERLRFDFSYPEKLTDEQIEKVMGLINEKIDADLPVSFIETSPEDAIKKGALHFFAEKYGEKVKMYTIGGENDYFSREICGGPHVTSTGLLGHARMIKQEKIGSGIIRIYVGLSEKN